MYRHIKLKQKKLYRVLFILLIVGFFTRLDNSNLYGCIVSYDDVFDLDNFIYSGISLSLLLLSFSLRNRRLGFIVLIIELAYWSLFLQSCDDKPNIDSLFKVVTRE